MNIGGKLLLVGILLITAPLIAVLLVAVRRAGAGLEELSSQQLVDRALGVARIVDSIYAEEMKLAFSLAGNPAIVTAAVARDRALRQLPRGSTRLGVSSGNNSPATTPIASALATLAPFGKYQILGGFYEGEALVDRQGIVFADIAPSHLGVDLHSREYFQKALGGVPNSGAVVSSLVSGQPIAPVAVPVSFNGKVVGVFALMLRIDFLEGMVTSTRVGRSGFAAIVDRTGMVIAHPNPQLIMKMNVLQARGLETLATRMVKGDVGNAHYVFRGVPKVAGFAPVKSTGWSVVLTLPESEYMAAAVDVRNLIVSISAAALLVAILCYLLFARSITVPLSKGIAFARTIAAGDFAQRLTIRRRDEIGLFARALNEVSERLSQRERAEEEKTRLEEQLLQAQKMESIGRLAGGIAHDFNNLLTPILGTTELLLLEGQAGDPTREGLEQIKKAAERARDLTRQLLAFGRKQLLAVRPDDLCRIVSDFMPLLRSTIREDITLILKLTDKPLGVVADGGQLQQVLMNLAINAQDAIEGAGTITIEMQETVLDNTHGDFSPEVAGGRYAVMIVSDTGNGMDQLTQSHLFEPFFTTKREGKGTGLGLSTVFGIVKQHGGHISVSSEPAQGSTFKVYLPLAEHAAASPSTSDSQGFENLRGTETILLVEDNDGVRQLTEKMLTRLGYEVVSTGDPRDAPGLWARSKGRICVVLTDVVMPSMNGRTLYRELAALQPTLKVLYMSGYTEDAIAEHGVLEEGINFIPKPFTLESLGRKLREVLGESQAHSSR